MLNLAETLVRSSVVNGDKTAILFADKSFNYSQINALSNQVANGLRTKGIGPGDKVALSCPNLPYFPMVYYGILKTGAAVVPLNVLLKAKEVQYHLEDSEAKAFFCFEGNEALPMGERGWEAYSKTDNCEHFIMITADPTAPTGISEASTFGMLINGQSPVSDVTQVQGDDTAVILYTSGTTGQPKGAELTHTNMLSNALASAVLTKLQRDDVHLITLPLFHSFGQTVQMNASVLTGASMVLIPRFEIDVVFTALEKHEVTIFAGVPTMYVALLNTPAVEEKYNLEKIAKNLKLAISGGAANPVEVINQFKERFDVPILEGYGLSETSPVASFNHLDFPTKVGSIGQPIIGVSISIRDTEGNEIEQGQVGEIAIRGHNIMKGYLNRPEETAKVIRDGWFYSGDMGRFDEDGYLYIVDRVKEMIIRGGFNVYPREIEECMMGHPDVAMVAVIGIPHDVHGEEIKAVVLPKEGTNPDADVMKAWTKERIADYKYPRHIEFVKELPMTATGKILKKELKT